MLAHAVSPQRAEARLGEEMFINGYALKTWEWLLTHVLDLLGRASHAGFLQGFYIWVCFACCARCFSTLIPVNEPLMAFNAACLRTLSPLSVLKHALGRKCSLMATPSKRDGANAQSGFKFRSVDSQNHFFLTVKLILNTYLKDKRIKKSSKLF